MQRGDPLQNSLVIANTSWIFEYRENLCSRQCAHAQVKYQDSSTPDARASYRTISPEITARAAKLRFRHLSPPTGREGEISRPLDHTRLIPFIHSARFIHSTNFCIYTTVSWIFSPCGTLRCLLMWSTFNSCACACNETPFWVQAPCWGLVPFHTVGDGARWRKIDEFAYARLLNKRNTSCYPIKVLLPLFWRFCFSICLLLWFDSKDLSEILSSLS